MAGSLMAFLKFNVTPATIFMGDTGSLMVGLVCSVLAIKFIEFHRESPESIYAFNAAPAVAMGILLFPIFDTIRVFTLRILAGKSPMYPDRQHIHHMLLDCGFSHMQATGILVFVSICCMLLVFSFQTIGLVLMANWLQSVNL